jgi:hypothetical protein
MCSISCEFLWQLHVVLMRSSNTNTNSNQNDQGEIILIREKSRKYIIMNRHLNGETWCECVCVHVQVYMCVLLYGVCARAHVRVCNRF